MSTSSIRLLMSWTAAAMLTYVAAPLANGGDQYAAFPRAGIEVLQPPGFVRMADPPGYQNLQTGANVIVELSDNPIEVEIAGLAHGTLEQNGIELVDKTDITLVGKKGVLVSTRQKNDNPGALAADASIAQWIVMFGDRTTVVVVASYPVSMKEQYSELFKQVVLSARPLTPAAAQPQREGFGRNGLAGSEDIDPREQIERAKAMHERLRTEMMRGGRRRFGRSEQDDKEQSKPLEPQTRSIARSLPRPKQATPSFEYRQQDVVATDPVGDADRGQSFADLAPEGGVLVGLNVIRGEEFGGNVAGVEPIYQVGGRYRSSGVYGSIDGESHKLIAPPGHAVGGVEIRKGIVMDAIRLVYMPLDGKELDADKLQRSEWVGGDGGRPDELVGDGSLVVGVSGTADERGLESVKLHFVVPDDVTIRDASSMAARKPPAAPHRKWTSANGKFSIDARLKSVDVENVLLIDTNGKTVRVPLAKLSQADQDYIQSQTEKSPFEVMAQEDE